MTTHLPVDGPGPFVLPKVEGFLGLVLAGGQQPVQMRFVLEGGSELHLPIAEYAFDKLLRQFAALRDAKDKESR